MKPERAQELYSEYAEGTLTPALAQALEQHFDADPSARADYAQFSTVYALLALPSGEEVEVPLGFRAKILERVSEQSERRETAKASRAASLFGNSIFGWLVPAAHRRAAGGALAALAAVVIGGILVTHPGGDKGQLRGGLDPIPGISTPSAPSGIVQSVEMQANTDYHLFHLHLPSDVPAATVSAYVVSATEQITDPAHLADATPAVSGQHLTNHQGLQIPVAPVNAPPAGSTLNLLVQYKPDAAGSVTRAEAVFTPFGTPSADMPAPVNTSFLDGMQAVAAHYGATVVVDVSAAPTQPVTASFAGTDPASPLADMANTAGYTVRKTADNTYYVYKG